MRFLGFRVQTLEPLGLKSSGIWDSEGFPSEGYRLEASDRVATMRFGLREFDLATLELKRLHFTVGRPETRKCSTQKTPRLKPGPSRHGHMDDYHRLWPTLPAGSMYCENERGVKT